MTAAEDFASLEDFKAAVETIPPARADQVRRLFLDQWVDSGSRRFREAVGTLRRYFDGQAYTGYLWDYLRGARVVSERGIREWIDPTIPTYVMWDLHSSTRVRVHDYFRFPRGTLLRAPVETIWRGMAFLPEDVYLFDDSWSWATALTHEDVDGARYCLWVPASFGPDG